MNRAGGGNPRLKRLGLIALSASSLSALVFLQPVLSAPPDPGPAPSARNLVEGDAHLVPLLLYFLQEQKLKKELERRDAIIADLARRVEQLEHAPNASERDRAAAETRESVSLVVGSLPAAPADSPLKPSEGSTAGGAKATQAERGTTAAAAPDQASVDLVRRVARLEHLLTAIEHDPDGRGPVHHAADLPSAPRAGSSPKPPAATILAEARPPEVAQGTAAAAGAPEKFSVDLARRVERLARVLTAAELDRTVAGTGESAPLAAGLPAGSPEASTVAEATSAQAEQATTPSAEARPAQAEQSTTPPPATAPGQFEVDETTVDRALEQSLVERGALLKPLGTMQVEPTFSYTRRELKNVAVQENGMTVPGNLRRNEFEGDLTFRIGLPYDSQLDVTFPYNLVDQQVNTASGSNSDTGSGFGDINVGFSKTLLRQENWWPDLIGRVFWNADTGENSDNDVALNSGFNQLGGSLTALARKDPLAFVGSVSYEAAFENNNNRPGNDLGFSFGAFLAASPETSLRFVLNQNFIDDAKISGELIKGSNQVQSSVTLGGAVSIAPGVLIDVSTDIGLTDEAPDYVARVSVPIQFNLPIK